MKKKTFFTILIIFFSVMLAVGIYYINIKFIKYDPNDVQPNITFLDVGQKVSRQEVDDLISKREGAGAGIYEYNEMLEGDSSTNGCTAFWKDSKHYKVNVHYLSSDFLYVVNNGAVYEPMGNVENNGEINNPIGNYEWYETSISKEWDLESFLVDMKNNIKNSRFIKEDYVNNEKVRVYRYSLFTKGNGLYTYYRCTVYGYSLFTKGNGVQYNIEFSVNDKGMTQKASVEEIFMPYNYSHFGKMTHDNGAKFVHDIIVTKSESRVFDLNEFIIPKEKIKAAPDHGSFD